MSAETLHLVGRALELNGGKLARIGSALEAWAWHLEEPNHRPVMATINLSIALRELAGDEELLEQLEDAEEQPWPAFREALMALEPARVG